MNISLRNTLLSFGLFAVLAGCSGQKIEQYATRQPVMVPQQFFNGTLTAHGILKNRSGDVTRYFNATINAYWKEGVGTLEERFEFNDGEIQYRTWTLKPAGSGVYVATAGDVVGEGHAKTAGNTMNLAYVLRIPYEGRTLDLSVDDWMYLVDSNTIINESVLSKWGIRVASIQLTIVRR